ncbi:MULTISPECIES: helix-turn-helix domain-containing protein [Collimonas]|jgi:quercetin dioxygenase-like cupin family protein|uniref:Helix-turn-helix family protein n=1 Tax=Collimonas pratensis TaxID=279113 RepID=A0ABM5Z611_9BURK|nr:MULTISPECIES: XRE family transcriptional regulator [Collimonas]AMP14204.1 helix-turn-helix family protein [Collimonas pratensis]NKI68794.1 cupin domain-containing protein [Collimonas pratensis]HWW99503.1 XRE family transcriptional regulator [Collimonas sp.]
MDIPELGISIRTRRHAINKTLVELATETGLTAGFISQLERNLTSPSITSLVVIAKALGVSIGDLIQQPAQLQPDTYRGQRQPYSVASGRVKYERLSTVFPGSQVHSVKFTMPAGYKSEMVSHEGDEMIYVLSGRVGYTVGTDNYVLNVGDSLHFDANIPHSIESLPHENQVAEVIWVGTVSLFDGPQQPEPAVQKHLLRGTEFF